MPLATHTIALVREVMDSFTTRDARKAEAVWRRDQEIDDLASRMQRGVIFRMSNNLTDGVSHDAGEVECSTHFLFIAKNLERVGDHATNIAEVIQYQLSGTWVREARPERRRAGGGDALTLSRREKYPETFSRGHLSFRFSAIRASMLNSCSCSAIVNP